MVGFMHLTLIHIALGTHKDTYACGGMCRDCNMGTRLNFLLKATHIKRPYQQSLSECGQEKCQESAILFCLDVILKMLFHKKVLMHIVCASAHLRAIRQTAAA